MSFIKNIEKTPMQSKKFLAYLLSNLINKAVIFYMVSKSTPTTAVAWAITAAAFIDIGYILGQAALDGFVRMAQIKTFSISDKSPKEETSDDQPLPP
jgi:hypothetical protein